MKLRLGGVNKLARLTILVSISSCSILPGNFNQLSKSFFNIKLNSLSISSNESQPFKRKVVLDDITYDAQIMRASNLITNLLFEGKIVSLFMGKVIATYGQDNNLHIINYEPFQDLMINSDYSSMAFIKLTNPETHYMEINFNYKTIALSDIKTKFFISDTPNTYIVEESFNVPQIRWSGKNYYVVDKTGTVIQSHQILSP